MIWDWKVSSIGDNDHPEANKSVQFSKTRSSLFNAFSFTLTLHSIHLSIYLYVVRHSTVQFREGIETSYLEAKLAETRPLISSSCYSNSLDSRLWSDVFLSFRDFACFYGLRNSGWMEFIFGTEIF